MHSVRRSALRAAGSSMKASVAVSRQQVTPAAMRLSKPTSTARATLPLAPNRYFSQTTRALEEQTSGGAVDGAPQAVNGNAPTTAEEAPVFGLYISNIVFDANETHLQDAFSKFGEIARIHLGRDNRGLSRGYAFVEYTTNEAAEQAIQEANNTFWHGRRIQVVRREPKRPQNKEADFTPSPHIFVGNIPYETSDADLNAIFRDLDNVTDIRVAVDRNTGWPRGFAHADFADVESAQNAIEKLGGKDLNGRRLRVSFAQSPKANRKRDLDSDNAFKPTI